MSKINDAPFPQANDMEKVILVLNVDTEENLKNYQYMSIYLGDISDRQVDYYISACVYLGLISKEKHFTNLGKRIRNLVGLEQDAELARIIAADEVFGFVLFQQLFLNSELDKLEIIDIMKDRVTLNSDAMYERRASTVISWLRWVKNKMD